MRATLYTILHFFIRENIIVASAVTALALSTFYIFHQPVAYPYLLSLWAGSRMVELCSHSGVLFLFAQLTGEDATIPFWGAEYPIQCSFS